MSFKFCLQFMNNVLYDAFAEFMRNTATLSVDGWAYSAAWSGWSYEIHLMINDLWISLRPFIQNHWQSVYWRLEILRSLLEQNSYPPRSHSLQVQMLTRPNPLIVAFALPFLFCHSRATIYAFSNIFISIIIYLICKTSKHNEIHHINYKRVHRKCIYSLTEIESYINHIIHTCMNEKNETKRKKNNNKRKKQM